MKFPKGKITKGLSKSQDETLSFSKSALYSFWSKTIKIILKFMSSIYVLVFGLNYFSASLYPYLTPYPIAPMWSQ
jgi:hypothetical protein